LLLWSVASRDEKGSDLNVRDLSTGAKIRLTHVDRQRKIEQREGIPMLSGMTRIRRQKTSSVPGSRNGFRFVDLTT
jgi:hypothetical protein